MYHKLKIIGFRFTFIFVIGFIFTLSFPFYFLPNFGKICSPITQFINTFWVSLLSINKSAYLVVISDSTGLYLNLITLFILSFLGSFIWTIIKKFNLNNTLKKWFAIGVAYYLALILLKYGFDKIFKHQFYLPEPNTLYTPLGSLSKDILFWSSMGSSYSYSFFSGIIELIPASLLLFKKTRFIGGLLSFMVLINVVMLNFGFDISVKVFSLFLLGLSIIVIIPNLKQLFIFLFTSKQTQQTIEINQFKSNNNLLKYAIFKSVIIGLFLFEALGGFFKTNNFNDDNYKRPYLYGAYTNINTKDYIKRIFIHRKQYFIIQNQLDKFTSYTLVFSKNLNKIVLTNNLNEHFVLNLNKNKFNGISLNGFLEKDSINIITKKETLTNLPLLKNNSFNWTFDN